MKRLFLLLFLFIAIPAYAGSYTPQVGDIAVFYTHDVTGTEVPLIHAVCQMFPKSSIGIDKVNCEDTCSKVYIHSEVVDPDNWNPTDECNSSGLNSCEYEIYRGLPDSIDLNAMLSYSRDILKNHQSDYYQPWDKWIPYLLDNNQPIDYTFLNTGQSKDDYIHVATSGFRDRKWMCISLTMDSILYGWYVGDPSDEQNWESVDNIAKIENLAPGEMPDMLEKALGMSLYYSSE